MCEIQVTNSDSSTSTDSWAILSEVPSDISENSTPTTQSCEKIDIEADSSDTTKEHQKHSDGFLTFDEYLQERLIEHDYEYDDKPQKLKNFYKNTSTFGWRKCKASNLGITIFITILLTLSAFATLCSTFSQPSLEVSDMPKTDFASQNMFDVKNDATYKEAIIKDTNNTIEEIKHIDKILKIQEFLNKTNLIKPPLIEEIKEITPPCNETIVEQKPQQKIDVSIKEPKITLAKSSKVKINTQRTKWMILREILTNTNIHALISLIMTNVYLLTLLLDISKRYDKDSSIHRNLIELKHKLAEELIREQNEKEELTKSLFNELPLIFEDSARNNNAMSKSASQNKALQKFIKKRSSKFVNTHLPCISLKSCPTLKQTTSTALSPVLVSASCIESGKSECERRFDELDLYHKKFDSLKQDQRDRIKLLKQKFKNEVSYIRDTEEESDARAEKINKTSQKFIRKMKINRDKYLIELRKIRELRLKSASKKEGKLKNACVGKYEVALPMIYEFGQHLKDNQKQF